MLGNILPYLSAREHPYAKKKGRGGKGISMTRKIKSWLRKTGVNGLVMRMASVLKQNKYRKK